MKEQERIGLYRRCDAELRGRFLIQGKVLHTLGETGEDLLKKAGIPASSLSNARYAAIALALTSDKLNVTIHNGKKQTRFDEAIYDELTFEQCQLLAYATTYRGSSRTVKFRPTFDQFRELVKKKDWDAELECYFANGRSLADNRAYHAEQQKLLDEQKKATEAALAAAAATPPAAAEGAMPPAPVIIRGPVAATPEPEEVDEEGIKAEGTEAPSMNTEPETASAPVVTAGTTCVVTGEAGEDPDDCTTHEHEEDPVASNVVAFTTAPPNVPCGTETDMSATSSKVDFTALANALHDTALAIRGVESLTVAQWEHAETLVQSNLHELRIRLKEAKKAASAAA
jgi:hypothetical protein